MAAVILANPFHDVFTRMGFNPATRDVLIEEGYETMEMLAGLDDEQIREMTRTMIRRFQNNPNVVFRTPAVNNLKAVVYWTQERIRLAFPLLPDMIQVADMARVTAHRVSEKERVALKEVVTKPPVLKKMDEWSKWFNLLQTYLSQSYGAAHCSLSYLIRALDTNGIVTLTPELLLGQHDAFLVAMMPLSGAHFVHDNHSLFDVVKTLVIDGPGWPFIQSYDLTRNGRASIVALRIQCEGRASVQLRKQQAYKRIADSHYGGERTRWSFTDFVTVHQEGHNVLQECNEPVAEGKKVTDFLDRISDDKMNVAKGVVMSNETYLEDFAKTQTFMSQFVKTTAAQSRVDRNLSSADRSGDRSDGPGEEGDGSEPYTGTLHSGNYSSEDYARLTAEQRKQIYDMRNEEKAAEQQRRDASAVDSTIESAVKRGNAGEQFGGQAHAGDQFTNHQERAIKKMKMAHIAALEKQLQEAKSSV
jgi:hypothetical protein